MASTPSLPGEHKLAWVVFDILDSARCVTQLVDHGNAHLYLWPAKKLLEEVLLEPIPF